MASPAGLNRPRPLFACLDDVIKGVSRPDSVFFIDAAVQKQVAGAMASVTTKLGFLTVVVVMTVMGGLLTLLRILWAILTHPFTVFKKVPRNGEATPCSLPLMRKIIQTYVYKQSFSSVDNMTPSVQLHL